MARRGFRSAALGVPTAWLAALPACPACYPGLAALLSALGLGALIGTGAQLLLTTAALSICLALLAYGARKRRSLGPLALGVAAVLITVMAKFMLDSIATTWAGVGLLSAASLWNAWPRGSLAPCEACSEAEAGGPVNARGA